LVFILIVGILPKTLQHEGNKIINDCLNAHKNPVLGLK